MGDFFIEFLPQPKKSTTRPQYNLVNMKFTPYLHFLIIFLGGCDENDERFGFATSSGIANEGDGVITITIDLGRNLTDGTTINYVVWLSIPER